MVRRRWAVSCQTEGPAGGTYGICSARAPARFDEPGRTCPTPTFETPFEANLTGANLWEANLTGAELGSWR